MDRDLASFTAPHPIPVRTGMTIGEFARMAAAEKKIGVALTVVPLEGWTRGRWYDETGLPWTNPSPNIRSVTQALLYSGIGLLEATNLSVGRGTDTPFEVVGAPWIEPAGLAEALNGLRLAGNPLRADLVHADGERARPRGLRRRAPRRHRPRGGAPGDGGAGPGHARYGPVIATSSGPRPSRTSS